MKISVIICTYNREAYILDSLTSIKDQNFDTSQYEVILIDNNSTDATPLLCMQFAQQKGSLQFHYYKELQQGLSHARNRGIEMSKGDIIIFLDDDAVACKNYLHEVDMFFTSHPQVSAMGGRIFPRFETKQPSWMPSQLTPLFSIIDLGETDKKFSKGKYPVGANMAFKKEVFEQCGVFNPELGRTGKNMMGGEEKDLFYRIKDHNFSVWYAAKPWVYHIIPESRTTKLFIKAQAIGVGQSERLRTQGNSFQRIVSISKEILKWGATFILAFEQLITLHKSKAQMLILFRTWVSGGMLNILKVK